MEVAAALTWRGGVADAAWLHRMTSRAAVRSAVRRGEVHRLARGRYGLPDAEAALRAAARLSGVASHLSAAQLHGWELSSRPERPAVIVPRGRNVTPDRRRGVDLRWRDLTDDQVWNGRTTAGRTVIDCARDLPFDQALAVADSALRHRNVTRGRLQDLAEQVRGPGRPACLRVAEQASGLAANPFESVLRAVSLDVPGLHLEPQVVIDEDDWQGRPDLVDRERRIVAEADSFEFHGLRSGLVRDCERYNALSLRGWLVLRFSWEHVMLHPDYVRACLEAAAREAPARRSRSRVPGRRAG